MTCYRAALALLLCSCGIVLSVGPAHAQFPQQGPKLVATAGPGALFGYSLAVSADGNTAIVGSRNGVPGGAWIFIRNGGVWSPQSPILVGSGPSPSTTQGVSVSISADGNTAIIGGETSSGTGAAWIWTRSDGVWTEQARLVGSDATSASHLGWSVDLSGDGNTAIVGGMGDNQAAGAAWIFTRIGTTWAQHGPKLVGSGAVGQAQQGSDVALSSDGSTAIVGGFVDDNLKGAVWVWTRTAGVWNQQGPKLVGSSSSAFAGQGLAVAVSSDGNTVVVGGYEENNTDGAAWVWTRNKAVWTQQGPKLTPPVSLARMGWSVSLSGDGNTVDNGAGFGAQTAPQTVRVTQRGAGTVTWTAASNVPWLVVSPTSGTGSTALTISTQFAPGLVPSQTGVVTLTLTGASTTTGPLRVGATLNVLSPSAASAPFGSFDTPVDGTTGVTGSIAVTGWALDDVEVARVRILREPVEGEPAGTLVYIGDAMQVDGARPDVQAMFASAPRNGRAGWGYLMLTNFLPALGNGTFRFHAIADDADGHSTMLGSKTITCTNSAATAPTGTIDTPTQGGVVSGIVTNFGWVLSPFPRRADPPAGGTVQVVIDGAFVSAVPSGWTSRPDLTALFPAAQYPGIVNALGVATFDSTSLANGVHTIAWVVTDDRGTASGIGSRYFTVSNDSLLPHSVEGTERMRSVRAVDIATNESAPIRGRRGFNPETKFQTYTSHDGRITLQAEELDRVELQLGDAGGYRHAGYLRTGTKLGPLPVGSALDPMTGVFAWLPGVGFVGAYDLVFVQSAGADVVARRDVRIVLNPRGSNRVGAQTVIDGALPAADGSLTLAGWAADLDAAADTGVDSIHVWAYAVGARRSADPVWLGVATYGVHRPDVAAIFGAHFLRSGYSLNVQGLTAGTYDVAVFAYSTVLGQFTAAKTVRVAVR